MTELLRPAEAARRFQVSTDTLWRWANRGLVGRSRMHGMTFYSASDINDVIRAEFVSRTVVPLSPEVAAERTAAESEDWRQMAPWSRSEATR